MKQSLKASKGTEFIAQYVILETLNVLKPSSSECGFHSRKSKKLPGTVSSE